MFVSNGIADGSAAADDNDNKNDEIAFLDTYEYLLVVGKRKLYKDFRDLCKYVLTNLTGHLLCTYVLTTKTGHLLCKYVLTNLTGHLL